MKKSIKIFIEVYGREVWVTRDAWEARRLSWKHCGVTTDDDFFQGCNGAVTYGNGALICYIKNMSPRTLAHEIGHLTMNICRDAGVIIDVDNQEPFTYLLGEVAAKVYGALYKLEPEVTK